MANIQPPILLASSSVYRRQLLEKLRLTFDWHAPAINEQARPGESAQALVERLACKKAQALAAQYPDHIIIGSDQVAVLSAGNGALSNDHVLGKPGSFDKAVAQLQACSGRSVTFYTGLAVYHPATNTLDSLVSPFEVGFRDLSDAEIQAYVKLEKPYDCAGSFKSEGLGVSLFKYMRGDDPNSLIGLPLIALLDILCGRYQITPLQTSPE